MTTARIPATLEELTVPIDVPQPYGKNPNKGDVERIQKSLMENGMYKPITLREGTNEILAGNHTYQAVKRLGWDRIPVTFMPCDDDNHAAQIVLVDNGSRDAASYDRQKHAALIESLPDPTYGTGLTAAEVSAIVLGVEQEPADAPEGADDDVAPAPEKPRTEPGDVWEMGPHRLVCGDATDPRVLEELLGRERPDMMWTDPPYGVEYEGKTKDKLRIKNDGAFGLKELLDGAFGAAADVLKPGAPVYVAHADTERLTFETALRAAGFLVRQNLVWVKNTMVLGHSDYHYKHEPILQAEQPLFDDGTPQPATGDELVEVRSHEPVLYGFAAGGTGRLGRGGPRWYGPNNGTTVFDFPKPPASKVHPTMKPVALILAQLANSVRRDHGKIILDLFAGSGSTMIAADAHGAQARLVELDPRYCDVIAMRWQKHSGELPKINGRPHTFPVRSED